jgi:hypothetical protein
MSVRVYKTLGFNILKNILNAGLAKLCIENRKFNKEKEERKNIMSEGRQTLLPPF